MPFTFLRSDSRLLGGVEVSHVAVYRDDEQVDEDDEQGACDCGKDCCD